MPQKKVMIVEDEGLIANDIAGQLAKSGYEVVSISSSGEEALTSLETCTPDLVLMDIRLKGKLDGIDTAMKVRSNHDLPVIFLTSHADQETLARAKHAEPFGYLVKPFRQLNLCSAIEMALYKHQSERVLAQREAWLATVLQSTADPTIVTDGDGFIQFLNTNAERLLNITSAGASGFHWTKAAPLFEKRSGLPADDLAPVAALRMTTLVLPRGLVLRRQDGTEVEIEGELSPSALRDSIAGTVITIRDVSQRNQEEAEFRHEQKMIAVGRMAGGVAHDFNNLLTVILGHGSELASELTDPAALQRVQAIVDASTTAAGFTQQLLTLARKQVIRHEMFRVNDAILRIASTLKNSLGPNIELRTDLSDDAGKVRMSVATIEQVIMNLVLNSRDAMSSGGEIIISSGKKDRVSDRAFGNSTESLVQILVADTGSGMPLEVQEHIFEPFFTTKPHGKGTGLGLAIVYGIVKDAFGEISVRSTPGIGTCFEILLPRAEEIVNAQPSAQPAPKTLGPKTVLLVEDQSAIRALIHNYLEQKGFNLIEAADGQEALALSELYEGRIDLLISDVLMPKMDGMTLSRQLTLSRPNLKVLLISGQPGEAIDLLRGANLNAEFMPKPFVLPSLLEKVQEMAE